MIVTNHLEERLLDQAQVQALYTRLWAGGSFTYSMPHAQIYAISRSTPCRLITLGDKIIPE